MVLLISCQREPHTRSHPPNLGKIYTSRQSSGLRSGECVGKRRECHTHHGISLAEWCIMFEPATMGARGSRVSHPFPMAAATAVRLAGNRELPAERSGVAAPATLRPAWIAVWEHRLDGNDRKATKNRVVPTRSGKTKERTIKPLNII